MLLNYAFINQPALDYPVRRLCLTFKVHASGYYAWLAEPKSVRALDDQRLLGLINYSCLESGCVYGYRKVYDDLRELGEQCGRNRVAQLMRQQGLRCKRVIGGDRAVMVASLQSPHQIIWSADSMSSNPTKFGSRT